MALRAQDLNTDSTRQKKSLNISFQKERKIYFCVFSPFQENSIGDSNPKADSILASMGNIKVGILPLVSLDYSETITCDSCHRFSAESIPWIIEHYLEQAFEHASPGLFSHSGLFNLQLLSPHDDLTIAKSPMFMEDLAKLQFPIQDWFFNYEEEFILREKDRFTSLETKEILNNLGGLYKHGLLLIPYNFKMRVKPKSQNTHHGEYHFSFDLILWDVINARPFWVLEYHSGTVKGDLNLPLEKQLEPIQTYLTHLPAKIKKAQSLEEK